MKCVIGLVLLGLFCNNAVRADDTAKAGTDGASQSGRIVNGVGTYITDHKYALSLRFDNQFFCGASIITASHALTAGHCVFPYRNTPSRVTVYGGSTMSNVGGTLIQAVRIAVHPSYNPNAFPGTSDYDAAIVTVTANGFSGRRNMAPIPLQTAEVSAGTRCHVVGWGSTNYNGPAPTNDLRYANMDVVSQQTCARAWASFPSQSVTSNMICAKYSNGVDTCKGDSGGALVCGGRLSGIISFTNPTCNSAWPAGFAKIVAPTIRSFIRGIAGV
ncbi:trypsin alpha-3-like [Anopheles stephensi]|uniref:trypsin alpha-3-like n=1 Tax=Anopheles stephensi TaxID=30069 RepID=UPI0007D53094|nr:trypsin alpha-3-like [Anopheles stephensi]